MAPRPASNRYASRADGDPESYRQTSEIPISDQDEEDDSDFVPPYQSMNHNDIEYILDMTGMDELVEEDADDNDDVDDGDDDDDEHDDDDDYNDVLDEEEQDDDDDGEEVEFQDASETPLDLSDADHLDDNRVGSGRNAGRTRQQISITIGGADDGTMQPNILRLIRQASVGRVLAQLRRGISDDDEIGEHRRAARRRARAAAPQFPKIPSDKGRELMESGTFGTNERDLGQYSRKKSLASRIMRRELGIDTRGQQKLGNRIASQSLIPSSQADTIIHYDFRCYSGQFSDDGNFFFSCSQDFNVRMYDTSNPYDWKYYRTVRYPFGQWTITDASLSPDNKYLAYSSIRTIVCLAPTDPEQDAEPFNLDFDNIGRSRMSSYSRGGFGIWSIRFSGDGRELVAGTSDHSVFVYDIETRQSILRIHGHEDDVNAVCFGDKSSPHLLYSGSDDTTLKVWDRRSLRDEREAGVFLGHTEGLTYVDSKGDGRYVLSNSKDQTMKLWDLRKMISTEKAEKVDIDDYKTGFDYRFQDYDENDYRPHPYDCSLVTFRGHRVLRTLIRCHFSPPGSTDSRYVYTGSEDGSIFIYNLDATLAGKINVQKATQNTRPRFGGDSGYPLYNDISRERWRTCIRDASWHPYAPVVAATSWNGYGMTKGTCTVHTWNDGLEEDEADPEMGHRVNAHLQEEPQYYEPPSRISPDPSLRQRMLRALADV